MLDEILEQWHPSIGKAILENWEFSEPMCQAVGDQNDLERVELENVDLTDVIAVALLLAGHDGDQASLVPDLDKLPATLRLGLTRSRLVNVMKDSASEVSALSDALGG